MYRNDYKPPPPPPDDVPRDAHQFTPPEEYDLNFVLGPIRTLKSDKVELRPFIPSLYAQLYVDHLHSIPYVDDLLTLPQNNLGETLYWLESRARRNNTGMAFVIFVNPSAHPSFQSPSFPISPIADPTASPGTEHWLMAGSLSVFRVSTTDLSAETGSILFQYFHGKGIATHAVTLAMQYAMEMPADGGLGMRRLQWTSQMKNLAAQGLGRKLGFKYEGVLRCEHTLREGQRDEGLKGRKGDGAWGRESRDLYYAGITYLDWEGGVREHVKELLEK